jgi:hypothetical protein
MRGDQREKPGDQRGVLSRGTWVSLETVHITLSAFPSVCKKADDLIEWFNTNQL